MADEALTKRAAYHHGNLPGALVEAAHALIDEQGLAALTLRAVAQRVGVTHAAPYRHFKDKAALLAAVATRSLGELEKMLREQSDAAGIAGAYVAFATSRPASYEVIFGASERTAVAPLLRELMPNLDHASAHAVWAICHGLALLINTGQIEVAAPAVLASASVTRVVSK